MKFDHIEYAVCTDCLFFVAYGDVPEDRDEKEFTDAIAREVGDKKARFVVGLRPTSEDPDGDGYNEFSWHECELCGSPLGGARHGLTLLIEKE